MNDEFTDGIESVDESEIGSANNDSNKKDYEEKIEATEEFDS